MTNQLSPACSSTPRTSLRRSLIITTAFLGVLQGGVALAQLDEITVTAQKREQGINDVGITVNAFSAQQLENYGVKDATDLEFITPGLTVTDAQPNGVPVYTIRGVGFADYTTTSSSTVGLYFDESNIPYSVMSRGVLFDVERVEVLKGPQGDLYGRNTTAGQINFVSRKPTKEFSAGANLEYGRFGVLDIAGFVSGPVSDNVQVRLAAKTVQSTADGWQQSLSRPGDTLGEREEYAVRGLIIVDFNDSASLLVNLHYFRDKSDNIAATPVDGLEIGAGSSLALPVADPVIFSTGDNRAADWGDNFRPQRNNTSKGASAKLDWDIFDGVNLTTITSYDRFDRDPETYDPSGVAFIDAQGVNHTEIDVFSQEVRFSSNNDSNLYWIAGAFYSYDDISEDYYLGMQESFFALALGIGEIATRYDQTTESIAGFAHIEWEFAPQFRLTLGARYTAEDREWSGCTYDTGDGSLAFGWNNILTPFTILLNGLPDPGPLAAGGCGIYDEIPGTPDFGTFAVFSRTIETNRWMWKATLDYAPSEDILLYATVSRGFKSGGFNGAAAQTHSQLLPIKPETLTSYEAGMKSTLFDGRMQVNLSGFYYDYEDKQEPTVSVTPVGNISGLTNVPKSRVLGAELEAHWQVAEGLLVDLGVAYLDTKITEYEAIDDVLSVYPTVVTFDASGSELANSPNWQVNATATKTWPITDKLNLFVASDVAYKGDNAGSVQMPISDYVLVNARAGLASADGKWTGTLWGRNILNDQYWLAASGSNCCFVRINGMPATYGVSLAYSF